MSGLTATRGAQSAGEVRSRRKGRWSAPCRFGNRRSGAAQPRGSVGTAKGLGELGGRDAVVSVWGGIGNQLFCWAAGYRFARRNGLNLILELSSFARDPFGRRFLLDHVGASYDGAVIDSWFGRHVWAFARRLATRTRGALWLGRFRYYCESGPGLHLGVLASEWHRSCRLQGYWQAPEYSEGVRGEIASMLRFPSCNRGRGTPGRLDVCVHVRSYGEDPLADRARLGSDYYQAAYAYFTRCLGNPRFHVFSDDIAWARAQCLLPSRYEVASQGHSKRCADWGLCELGEMRQFCNFVVANSSFSWWAAFLASPGTLTVAPAWARNCWAVHHGVPASWIQL